ncbi:GDYXXLXY domain-containing protein [Pelomonas sp. CA6]|uniref:GDYXXLXY domain-containing protein n=1 Tax=Pelomonas sp. CA6 TaxID=2907999 RepID=UPI001F4C452F|nr:GDYXXLXY domain-containing protein [Pelomonas sp. CA6]MCH7345703.1 GDYXXLXY domain-containing protein [Pelomonas sp. CA6]
MTQSAWMATARAQGLLPEGDETVAVGRPWPVVLLTALGAWLAVLPLLGFLALLFGSAWDQGATAYLVGGALLALAVTLLRAQDLALFLEQFALPLLLLGLCGLGYGLGRDLPPRVAAVASLLLDAALIALLPRAWLRLLLGAAAAPLLVLLLAPHWGLSQDPALWGAVHGVLLLWALGLALQHRLGLDARRAAVAAAMEPVLQGWALALLAMLAWLAGPSFMVAGALGGGVMRELGGLAFRLLGSWDGAVLASLSVAATLAAGLVLMRAWPVLRRWRMLPALLLLAGLALLLPALGASLLVLALAASRRRWPLAIAAAAAALWVLGSFYYRLDWLLADKALVLVGGGALLGLWVRFAFGGFTLASSALARPDPGARGGRVAVLATALLSLLLVNGLIWQKEHLIASGRPVYVKLAPVDPRSLIQGDYMRLNYELPGQVAVQGLWGRRPRLELRVDERGIASEPRLLADGEAARPGLQLLELSPVNGRWTLVSDAWFFEEGQEPKLRAAAYGEFRVQPDGRALLVGLVDEQLRRVP